LECSRLDVLGRNIPRGQRRPVFPWALIFTLSLALVSPLQARGQVVERHLPPPASSTAPVVAAPPAPAVMNDDQPLGAELRAIVLLGPDDSVVTGSSQAIAVSASLRHIDRASVQRSLGGFLGKALTRSLISQIEAEIVRAYRHQGFPFVEVSTPEQEISSGVLQIRIVEFRLGKLTIAGARANEGERIARAIRLAPGDEIDAGRLSQDLDWLSRAGVHPRRGTGRDRPRLGRRSAPPVAGPGGLFQLRRLAH
jgi:hemolysin activation/secretion protein